MFVITATFDTERAYAAINEMLAMGDAPERLAELLGLTRDVEMITQGAAKASFKRLITDIKGLRRRQEIGEQIAEIESGQSMSRFLGSGFKEKQIAKLEEERKKFGSTLDTPTWFYQHPRVLLLSAIRDFALDGSQQGDAAWQEIDVAQLAFPLATLFETADLEFAERLVAELEKPLKKIEPKFLLEQFEGQRSITFDLETGVATYYMPARKEA
jgi:hypothetical protein